MTLRTILRTFITGLFLTLAILLNTGCEKTIHEAQAPAITNRPLQLAAASVSPSANTPIHATR